MEKENNDFASSSNEEMPRIKGTTVPLVIAAASGTLVISAAIISLVMLLSHVYIFGNPTMMDQWQQMLMQRQRAWFAEAVSVVLVAAGIANLAGSYLLYRRPLQTEQWGYLILMGSVTALFWIGGFLIGPLLGIVAGIIAVYQGRKTFAV
jgi:hypothetical protein